MRILCSTFCVATLLFLSSCGGSGDAPSAPLNSTGPTNLHIIENGLGADRGDFYHTPEGSEVFPYLWAQSLTSSVTRRPFLENMERFGLIPDNSKPGTGYIGLTVAPRRGLGVEMVGVNCAACHVGQLQYQDTGIRVDGAPNMFDMFGFATELANSVEATMTHPSELLTFMGKVHQAHPFGLSEMEQTVNDFLKDEPPDTLITNDEADDAAEDLTTLEALRKKVRLGMSYVALLRAMAGLMNPDNTIAGPGRADAFGTARTVFFAGKEPLTAPSSYPFIWDFEHTTWFHWNTNTNSVLERNVGQSLGLGASFDPKTCETSILFDNLDRMEKLGYKITAPTWPEDVLGPINRDLAARGKIVYQENCTQCHDNYSISNDSLALKDYRTLPVRAVGTDPREAENVLIPVQANVNFCMDREPSLQQMTFAQGHTLLLGRLQETFFRNNNISPEQQATWTGGRPAAVWRDSAKDAPEGAVYPAKPLVGVWATAPFLHNGSVPSLRAMLTRPDDRPKRFPVGQRNYDPVNLGYAVDESNPPFMFDTSIVGNSNSGHVYGTQLSDDDKDALLAFIKSLTDADRDTLHQEFMARQRR